MERKKYISFSLFGKIPKYLYGAVANCILAKTLFPDWKLVFHVDKTVPQQIIKQINRHDNCEIEFHSQGIGTFWRFETIDREDADIVLCRDVDSYLLDRDVIALNIWQKSDKDFLIIRDHPSHRNGPPIRAGMFGTKPLNFKVKDTFGDYFYKNYYGSDEDWLTEKIYPKIKDNCLILDEKRGNFPLLNGIHIGQWIEM